MSEKYHKFRSQFGTDLIKNIEEQKGNTNDTDNLISVNMTRKEFAFILSVLKANILIEDIRDRVIDESKGKLTGEEKTTLLRVFNEQNALEQYCLNKRGQREV